MSSRRARVKRATASRLPTTYIVILVVSLVSGGIVYAYNSGWLKPPGPGPTYAVTINAYCITEVAEVSVSISTDFGVEFTTPHTFTGLTGTHTFAVPSTDLSSHDFVKWDAGPTSLAITVSFAGTFTAQYEGGPPQPPVLVGTWEKRGKVLSDALGINEPNVIYEGNPQILTQQSRVYKMWYRVGWAVCSVDYAESIDGLTWVKYSGNPVLVGGFYPCPFVFKYNNQFYMYVHGGDWVRLNRYVSNNGLSWALDAANTLTCGSSGWDNHALGNLCVWVESGEWKMIYEANGLGGTGMWSLGFATSSDGKVWSKYSGNPVISSGGGCGGAYIIKSGGTYYMWYHGGGLPTEIYLATSTNLVSWATSPSPVLRRTELWEGSDSSEGQVADPTICVVGTTVWMWYCGVHRQVSGDQAIGAAILHP